MAAARIGVPALPTNRHDRAALGVIATYLHELTEHGQPREQAATTASPALPALELLDGSDDAAACIACAA
ncbi:hypothetical protein Q5424_21645 [Conexibacter sp. JD483]|uniref:hypothetical protein n=1 Tax=unclassified Conexibacter TaxID=2627773 RepID=UPI0027176C05|nr:MULTISPECIES: hypothetical protein [unclassified Conexibacter]MDO8189102.1 hypothetical protein [Conexibacter sp. CPCC 205706]MDO8200850.1 hypothetical protein [Conexibacter sp. CPCC 205762]MDR9371717.1 hypothetical protein [Conexibacter sp. JD483]